MNPKISTARPARRRGIGLLCAALSLSASVLAGVPPQCACAAESRDEPAAAALADSVYQLPRVLVEGKRLRRHLARETSSLASQVIVPSEHPRRFATPAGLLGEAAGLELRRQGGLGSFSTASLRGSGAQEVAVFLDGVDLRSPFTGLALLDELPLADVARIEIFRGGVPAELGGGAGGAINVVTGESSELRGGVALGGFGTRKGHVATGGTGPWDLRWSLAGGMLESASDFLYLDRNGTNFSNSADDSLRLRSNADFRGGDLLGRLRWEPGRGGPSGRYELYYRYLRRQNGVPGSESLPTSKTRSLRSGHDARASWESPLLPGNLRLHLLGYGRRGWTRFLNPGDESGPFLVADETRDLLHSQGLQARADIYLLPLHILLRAEESSDRFLPENLNPRKGRGYERRRGGRRVEGEARLLLMDSRLLLTGAYGEERLSDNYFGPPPRHRLPALPRAEHETRGNFRRGGARLRVLDRASAARALSVDLSLNAGSAYRPPTLLELFGQDVSIRGNPELSPEQGRQADAGLRVLAEYRGLSARAEYSRFRRTLRDQILFLRNSQYSVGAVNLAASEVDGHELQLSVAARGAWLTLAATRQNSIDRGENPAYAGKQLPYRSPSHLFARAGGELARLRCYLDIDRRSSVFTDRYNDADRALPAASLWGAGLRLRVNESVSVGVEGMNLTDARVEDYLGYPLPGRMWMVGLEWRRMTGIPNAQQER